MVDISNIPSQKSPLRKGWTTGACATAATRSAFHALLSGKFLDPVTITLPKGEMPAFALAYEKQGAGFFEAGIIKDAGDDPDVTHGAMIIARISHNIKGEGILFKAGNGVGTITRPGLPLPVGEAAINPVPRAMMKATIENLCHKFQCDPDIIVEIIVPNGEKIAHKTWNSRLGIEGGISILGTTGIVHPFSCSAWIHSIHRGIDVAFAEGLPHVAGATGSTSEKAVQDFYNLPDHALLDMGDFVGGVLKYIRKNPIAKLTICGGFAKITKLSQGLMDLHSKRGEVDFESLAQMAENVGKRELAKALQNANTAKHARELALEEGLDLAPLIAQKALNKAKDVLKNAPITLDIMIVDRGGNLIAHAQETGKGSV